MAVVLWLGSVGRALAKTEVLIWNTAGQNDPVCLYGQITVVATIQGIYYCGAQFNHGYCGIQHLRHDLHTALFSIWDTSPTLLARIIESDPGARPGRFGGEGTGSHVNFDNSWSVGKTYQFFLEKQPGQQPDTTDTKFFVVDPASGDWRHIATINAADGTKRAGTSFRGVMSWIENIGGRADPAAPKIAVYDLWLGSDVHEMKRLTRCSGRSGSGGWGQLRGEYFLAEGSRENLDAQFAKLEPAYGKAVFGTDGKELPPLPDKPLGDRLVEELAHLPE